MRHKSLRLVCGLFAGLTIGSAAGSAEPEPVPSTTAVDVRHATDGSGPSHVLTLGRYLLVVDPLEATITRYPLADPRASFGAAKCTFSRDFSPWRSVVKASGTWLVAEDDHHAMFLTPASVEAMSGGECPSTSTPARAVIAPPRFTRGTSAAIVHLASPTGGPRLTIDALRTGSVVDARVLGTLPGGRTVVFWKRLEALPRAGEPGAERYIAQGRVFVSLFVTIFDRAGTPVAQHRVLDFNFVSTEHGIQAAYSGMKKRGFEYLALGADNALYGLTSEGKDFVIKRFDLLNATAGADIRLASINSVVDNEGDLTDLDPVEEPPLLVATVAGWQQKLEDRAAEFISVTWRIPPGGFASPCIPINDGEKGDRCRVMYRDGRLVERDDGAVASGAATAVLNGEGGPVAEWARPRFLVGRADGYVGTGVPYSFGGDSSPAELRAFRPEVSPPANYNATPFGHIVEELTLESGSYIKGTYPLGIDCSHLVNRLLATIGATKVVVPEAGTKPSIPRGWFATPVEHARDLRTGDVFIKDGHVVIFMKTVQVGGTRPARRGQGGLQGAVGYVVYEAASRCGRVCRSVYGLDYFNGWWMLRPRTIAAAGGIANPNGAPTWVSRTVAATYLRSEIARAPVN